MRIATNRQWKDSDGNRQEVSEFHAVVSYGRLAEIVAAYGTRGKRVYVEGHLRTRDYAASDGVRRYVTEIIADTVKLLNARRAEDAAPETGDAAEDRA
jgi:single-strand DNA-binding protein